MKKRKMFRKLDEKVGKVDELDGKMDEKVDYTIFAIPRPLSASLWVESSRSSPPSTYYWRALLCEKRAFHSTSYFYYLKIKGVICVCANYQFLICNTSAVTKT